MNRFIYGVVGSNVIPPIPPPSCVYLLDAGQTEIISLFPGKFPMDISNGGATVSYGTTPVYNMFGAASAGTLDQTSSVYLNLGPTAPPVCFELQFNMPVLYGTQPGFSKLEMVIKPKDQSSILLGGISATAQAGYPMGIKPPVQPSLYLSLGNTSANLGAPWTQPRIGVRLVPATSQAFIYLNGVLQGSSTPFGNAAEACILIMGECQDFQVGYTSAVTLISSPADFLTNFPQPGVRTTICGQVF